MVQQFLISNKPRNFTGLHNPVHDSRLLSLKCCSEYVGCSEAWRRLSHVMTRERDSGLGRTQTLSTHKACLWLVSDTLSWPLIGWDSVCTGIILQHSRGPFISPTPATLTKWSPQIKLKDSPQRKQRACTNYIYLVFEDSASPSSLGLSFRKLNWILVRTWIGLSWHFMYVGKFNSSLLGIFFFSNRKVLWDWVEIKILVKSEGRKARARSKSMKQFISWCKGKQLQWSFIQ